VDWMHLAQDSDQWRTVMNMVIWTFGFHERRGTSWLAEWLSASRVGPCFVELVSQLQNQVLALY